MQQSLIGALAYCYLFVVYRIFDNNKEIPTLTLAGDWVVVLGKGE